MPHFQRSMTIFIYIGYSVSHKPIKLLLFGIFFSILLAQSLSVKLCGMFTGKAKSEKLITDATPLGQAKGNVNNNGYNRWFGCCLHSSHNWKNNPMMGSCKLKRYCAEEEMQTFLLASEHLSLSGLRFCSLINMQKSYLVNSVSIYWIYICGHAFN